MRVDRLLSMILIISNKGRVTGNELAEHFEVSLRTVYRDIDKICEAGIPIASEGGKGGGFYVMENFSLDNMFLKKSEVQTLSAVMDNLGFLFGKNKQFNDILLKFENSNKKDENVKDRLNINMSHFSMEDELKEYLYLINSAIEESRLLELEYINRRMDFEKREVEPYYIDFSSGDWYLVGFCKTRNAFRRFKLVRIRNLKLGKGFTKLNVPRKEIRRKFNEEYNNKSIRVLLRFTGRIGAQLSEYFHKDNIKAAEDGSYIVEDSFPYEEGLIKFLLGFGRECEVVEPGYLREELNNYIKDMLQKYNG
ncbi:MAG: transcriptional regulator [Clostridia bacterium BRH_c25]|nr:MAG: transcriptional regulator [Clostridia bacterium BRH_c25]